MLTVEEASAIINTELEKISFPVEYANLYEPLKYILSAGGKRFRPVLVLLSCDLFGKDHGSAIPAALGMEIFHNFTLVHDDLMDNSPVRRNNPSVHVKWNPNVAILSGDAMSIISNQFVCKTELHLPRALSLFNKTALQVCEGQMLDMDFENQESVPMERYIHMIGLKTSVLIAASLKMGAIIAGAGGEDQDLLYDFGYNFGLAFQIRDDLLDVYGDEKTFGKKIGNDIVTNKKTFLLIKALELAKGADLKALKFLISGSQIDPDQKIKEVTVIYNKLGIKDLTEIRIRDYYKTALEKLNSVRVPDERKKILKDLGRRLVET
jgi:geranylgeranyl diphosphate synthase type II